MPKRKEEDKLPDPQTKKHVKVEHGVDALSDLFDNAASLVPFRRTEELPTNYAREEPEEPEEPDPSSPEQPQPSAQQRPLFQGLVTTPNQATPGQNTTEPNTTEQNTQNTQNTGRNTRSRPRV